MLNCSPEGGFFLNFFFLFLDVVSFSSSSSDDSQSESSVCQPSSRTDVSLGRFLDNGHGFAFPSLSNIKQRTLNVPGPCGFK